MASVGGRALDEVIPDKATLPLPPPPQPPPLPANGKYQRYARPNLIPYFIAGKTLRTRVWPPHPNAPGPTNAPKPHIIANYNNVTHEAVDGPTFTPHRKTYPFLYNLSRFLPCLVDRECNRHDRVVVPPAEDIRSGMLTNASLRQMHKRNAPYRLTEYEFKFSLSCLGGISIASSAAILGGACCAALSTVAPPSVLALACIAALATGLSVGKLANMFQQSISFDAVPDWMTSLYMTCETPKDVRANGLRRISLSSGLNIHSADYLSLAMQTVECAVFTKEGGFGIASLARGASAASL